MSEYCCNEMKDAVEKYGFIHKSKYGYQLIVFLDKISFCYSKKIIGCPFCRKKL